MWYRTIGDGLLALELFAGRGERVRRVQGSPARTDEETGPSWAEVPLAVKLTPLGALSFTSRAAVAVSAEARRAQLDGRARPAAVW